MKKTRTAIYFQKRYCLLVHSLILNQRMSVTAISANSSEKEVIDRTCSYNINQIVYINCIDAIKDGVTAADNEAVLHFNAVGDKMIKKSDIGVVKFDMNQEKIVKPESSVLFSKELASGKGVLHYKFINMKPKTLTLEQFEINRHRKCELQISTSKDEHSYKIQELVKFLQQKDELINKLQKKIQTLIVENRRKQDQNNENREQSKEKAISLHVKVNTANDNIRKQNQRLLFKLRELEEKNQEFEEQIAEYAKQKETFERQINMLKKHVEKYEKLGSMHESRVKSRGRTVSYVQPSFMRNSSISPYESNDWLQSQQQPTKITVNQPPQRRGSFMQQESEIVGRTNKNNSPQNTQNKLLQGKSSMYASNYVALNSQNSLGVQKDQSLTENEQISQLPPLQKEKDGQSALQKRISMQKEDLKWTSIIFERNEEIQILKRKIQIRATEVKNLQKQLEKAKVQIKKKDAQIKEMRKQSRRNLFFGQGTSSKELGRNRTDLQAQFERMQIEHDTQKVKLQQQIERLDKQREQLDKQSKRLKVVLTDKQQRQKTTEIKYNQLKKFTQRKQEEFIQYRQKSQQYDVINIKNKQLQGLLKTYDTKCEQLQKQNKRFSQLNTNLTVKLKDIQRQWERLKKSQRDFELARYQNINYVKTIQSFQSRYNELKKYCIKIESAYNKFVTTRKKGFSGGSQGKIMVEEAKQDKQIQQKFVELGKLMDDTQLTYYKQQLEDYDDEKAFVTIYFQKKIREEKERIYQNKDIPEDQRRTMVVEKEKQIQRNMQDKLQEMKSKNAKIEKAYEEINDRINQHRQNGFNKSSIPQQLRMMEKKISLFSEKEQERMHERKNMKQTIIQLNQQLKRASSSSYLLQQLPPAQALTLNKNATTNSRNQLLLSMFNESKQKTSLLQEARQRSQASQQRTYEENRKMNTQLVKENGELKMKNQKLTMDIEKIERKAQDRDKQLDQTFKKSEVQFKLKNDRLTEQIEKSTNEIQSLKKKYADSQAAVGKISEEATNLSYELEAKEQQIHKLQQKIVYYEQRIQQYEKGQRLMLDEVGQIKKNAEQNQNQLFSLIEARSDNFARIEKVKQVQIQKLKGIIKEVEMKLEAEMFENIQCKQKIQQLGSNYQRLEKQTQQKLEVQRIDIENKQLAYDQLYVKQFQATKQNEILQENLMQISTQIENKEVQIVELTYELTKWTKQLQVYKKQAQQYGEMEERYKDEIKGLQLLLDDKIQQIRGFQDKYKQFQMKIQYSAKDLQRLALTNLKFETEAKQFQDKYVAKQEQIIRVKQEHSMLQIQMRRQQAYYEDQQRQNEKLKLHIQELTSEVQRLNDLTTNNNTALRVSRKISSEVDKFDCPSPGRKKMPKRTTTLEVPQVSMIGAGGITPILPVSPNPLMRKMSENPFEPRQEGKKTSKLLRGTSIQYNQPPIHNINEDEEIAIHIQSPPNSKMPSRSSSNVHIDFEEGDDSIRYTNNAGIHGQKSYKPEQHPQIREQTEENQQHSGGFGKNMDLGDSKQDYIQDQQDYEQNIRQLQRQLIQSNEENQRLNIEVIELSKKIDELNLQIKQTPAPRPPSLGVSRRRSILDLPPAYPKETQRQSSEGRIERNPNPSQTVALQGHINRSSSGEIRSSRDAARLTNPANIGQLQQECESAELQIQYLNNELNAVKAEIQQMSKNNERLIEQAQLCRQTIEQLNNKLEQAQFQTEQAKNFIQFEQLYQQQKEVANELRLNIQELNKQIFEKQNHISVLMNENGQFMEQANQARTQCVSTQDNKVKLEQRNKQLTQTIAKLKIQYRKYEQSSQLQIVKLNEVVDDLKMKLREKDDEISVLGQQYLTIQNEKNNLIGYLEQNDKNQKKKVYQQGQLQLKYNQLQDELSKNDENRQNLYRTIKQLQLSLTQKEERSKNISNEMSMMIKKYQIKLHTNQDQIQMVQSKLAQKQKVITALKNEIGLYNQECNQLKALNDELTYQSTKVQKQLKDIMVTYTTQIQSYKQVIVSRQKEIINLRSVVDEKQNEHRNLLKNMRSIEKQKDNIQYDFIDTKNALEKLKNIKNKESHQLYTQMQYKSSQCQKLKTTIQKITNELQYKQQVINRESQKYESRLMAYKEKLERYEKLVQQFQFQLKKVEQRPTFQAHEEVLFENELLKNRVDELQEQLHNKTNIKDKQEVVYMEFKKYKINKDRQIQDLNSQMEKYGVKINELQESTYFLKRENDTLKRQNHNLLDLKEELSLECEDLKQSLQEVDKQLQFYKKRKLLDMQKLLNDTQ